MTGQRLVFKVAGIVVSAAFLIRCAKAFCSHFYDDLKRQLRNKRQQIALSQTPSQAPAAKVTARPVVHMNADRSARRPEWISFDGLDGTTGTVFEFDTEPSRGGGHSGAV
jgi:hypothetical protein